MSNRRLRKVFVPVELLVAANMLARGFGLGLRGSGTGAAVRAIDRNHRHGQESPLPLGGRGRFAKRTG